MAKIVIIGGGPGGYPAALKAASLGAEVTVIEKAKLGGVCLNCGCIPSKSLLDAAHRFDTVRTIAALGEEDALPASEIIVKNISWRKIQERQRAVTQKLTLGIQSLFRAKKVNYIAGEASFVNNREILVKYATGTLTVPFDYAIIATGSEAFLPSPFDAVKDKIYDNSTVFDMPRLPGTLTIVGGGVIGCEFAEMMTGLGVRVNIVEMQDRILPQEDEGLSRTLAQSLVKRGVKLYTGRTAATVSFENGKKLITLDDGSKLESDEILAAIGRTVDLTALKPENAGIAWTRKGIAVNPRTLQAKDNIYAVGDVNGLTLLAHAASRQGEVAASVICGRPAAYGTHAIPRAIYTRPEIASVGLTQKQAQDQGLDVKSQKTFLLANGRAQTQAETEGYFEILSERATGKILGANLCGAGATEIIHIISVALAAEMTTDQLKEVVFAHPTLSEALGDALSK